MNRALGIALLLALTCSTSVGTASGASQTYVRLCNHSGSALTPAWYLTNVDGNPAKAPRLVEGGGKLLGNGKCDNTTAMPTGKGELYIVVWFKSGSKNASGSTAKSYPLANSDVNIETKCSTEMDDASPVCILRPH